MKFVNQLVVSSLAVAILSGCSSSASERRQAKDDFKYLDVEAVPPLQFSSEYPVEVYPDFAIPAGEFSGGTGREVDIRSPQQVLELIPGARTEQRDGEVVLWLLTREERDKVWQTTKDLITARKDISLVEETENRLETDWVTWEEEEEEESLSSRYEIERFEQGSRYGFRINLIGWKEGRKEKPVSRANKERYNTLMTNLVTSRYDQQVREKAAREALELVKVIPLSMGQDRSGLPIIIARAQYNVFWQRVPEVLPAMGFTIEERNQSQGTVKAKYVAPEDEFWQRVGTKPLSYESESYTFLLGDLGNRTSINITDASGKPVTEEKLKEMLTVLSAVMKDSTSQEETSKQEK